MQEPHNDEVVFYSRYKSGYVDGSPLLNDRINAITFSSDSRLLAASDSAGSVVVFNCSTNFSIHIGYHRIGVQATALSWGQRYELYCGCSDGSLLRLRYKLTNHAVSATIRYDYEC